MNRIWPDFVRRITGVRKRNCIQGMQDGSLHSVSATRTVGMKPRIWYMIQCSRLKALEKISSFTYRGSGSLYAWISRIAINMALAQISRYKFRFSRLTTSVSEEQPDPTDDEFARIPQEKLLEFISGLPDTQRAIFNLFCMDGYSHKEIADMLGISERGSTSMLVKAKHTLRKQINDYIKNSE